MLWSKNSSIINSLVIVALFFTLWISITVCNPIRKHQQHLQRHSNSIIHAKVGEVINISCWFDPNLLAARMRQQQQQNFDLYDHYKSKKSSRRANRHKTSPSNLFPSGSSYNDEDEDEKEEWEEGREESENSWPQPQPQSPLSKIVNKVYELDWYFWDKNGKFKIISYGNLTASDYKYKTFVNREDLMNAAAIRSSQNLPQSSALYSQTSSRSSSNNNNNVFTYYLSALIESDQDEGVYQCINPDSPNFILRNVTVLIANNGVSRHFQSFIFILSINLTYLVFQLIN